MGGLQAAAGKKPCSTNNSCPRRSHQRTAHATIHWARNSEGSELGAAREIDANGIFIFQHLASCQLMGVVGFSSSLSLSTVYRGIASRGRVAEAIATGKNPMNQRSSSQNLKRMAAPSGREQNQRGSTLIFPVSSMLCRRDTTGLNSAFAAGSSPGAFHCAGAVFARWHRIFPLFIFI